MKTLFFLGFLVGHWTVQYFSYAFAVQYPTAETVWAILSLPVFNSSVSWTNDLFWAMTVVNSAIWAAGFTFVLSLLAGAIIE
jgi:hypothetical protein